MGCDRLMVKSLTPTELRMAKAGIKIVSDNRQVRHLYEILETYEAGIELKGTEVKSIREGKVNLRDGYAVLRSGELWLINVHISPYQTASLYFNHDPRRSRKLLLHRWEIRKLIGKVEQKGLTLVPTKMYLKRGLVKVEIALARGKKIYDKRETLKKRAEKREIERALKNY
jgi:SsrA-binding protein